MVECCRTCHYFVDGECTIHDEIFYNDSENLVDYAIGDGIIAEKLQEPLENLNLTDEEKEQLISDIEHILLNTVEGDPMESDFKVIEDDTFKCNKYM